MNVEQQGDTPNFLVLLAAYNGEQWIEQQIDTILTQQNVSVTLIISVDLSTDKTYEKCQTLVVKNPNLHVLEYGQRYGGAAQNFFRLIKDVDFSAYDYVALADQDDIWLENKLSYAACQLQHHVAEAFSSNVIAFWKNGKEVLVQKDYPQKQFDFLFEAAGPGCTYVFKRSALTLFKTFLNQHDSVIASLALHDWAIYAFFRSHGLKWHIDNRPSLYYRQHEANQVGVNNGWQAFCNRFSLIRSNWYGNQVRIMYGLFSEQIDAPFSLKRIFLMTHFFQLRRRSRDAYFLLTLLVFGIFR
jgi:rhamnosyltransferase